MPRVRPTGNDATGVIATASDDVWFTVPGNTVSLDTVAFLFNAVSNTVYDMNGSVIGGSIGIATVDTGASDCAVYIGQSGSVYGDVTAVLMKGSGHVISNQGSATSRTDDALTISGDSGTIRNSGTIDAGDNGMLMIGNLGTLFNSGTIMASDDGMSMVGNVATVTNTGTISAFEDGIDVNGSNVTVVNTGTIAAGDDGIDVQSPAGQTVRIVNSGTISSATGVIDSFVIEGNDGVELVTNSGLLIGDVKLFSSDDTYDGRQGTLLGEVDAGDGNDLVLGGSNDDLFYGRNGDDTLKGKGGDDFLSGNDGIDQIHGGIGDDDLRGGNDDDLLYGGTGDDALYGGTGADRLFGGQGDDFMTGGRDADRFFIYRNAGFDTITDFEVGTDLIVMTAYDLRNFADLSAALSQSKGDTFIDLSLLGGEGTLVIENSANSLSDSDFIF